MVTRPENFAEMPFSNAARRTGGRTGGAIGLAARLGIPSMIERVSLCPVEQLCSAKQYTRFANEIQLTLQRRPLLLEPRIACAGIDQSRVPLQSSKH
jgi:hypothetical protein